jgi:outer membrane protein assembly factor BamB
LVSINPQSGTIHWAVMYESPAPPTGYYYRYQPPQSDVSGPLVVGGLIFAKGMRSPRLVGIASDGPKVAWNRPAADSAVLVGADEERIYLGGEDLAAYSLKTQELVWATQLPRSAEWCRPLVTAGRIYQFTSRGVCEVDKKTGEIVTIFRGDDLDSLGGALFVAGGKLVTVSNLGITAYALDAPPQEARNP